MFLPQSSPSGPPGGMKKSHSTGSLATLTQNISVQTLGMLKSQSTEQLSCVLSDGHPIQLQLDTSRRMALGAARIRGGLESPSPHAHLAESATKLGSLGKEPSFDPLRNYSPFASRRRLGRKNATQAEMRLSHTGQRTQEGGNKMKETHGQGASMGNEGHLVTKGPPSPLLCDYNAEAGTTLHFQNDGQGPFNVKATLQKQKSRSLAFLNALAALYGTNALATKFVTETAPEAPTSLTSAVRFLSAAVVFAPALGKALKKKDPELLWAGLELGALVFVGAVAQAMAKGVSDASDASFLFVFTLVFVPILELCAGRAISKPTWLATIAAMSGMGFLEEEGGGLSQLASSPSLWALLGSVSSAMHIFRSEALAARFDPLELTSVQAAAVAGLGLGWEAWELMHSDTSVSMLADQLQSLPWSPLIYSGLVCAGLCNWLELHALRGVHASRAMLVYTSIPVWGAAASSLYPGGDLSALLHLSPTAALGAMMMVGASVAATAAQPPPSKTAPDMAPPTSAPAGSIQEAAANPAPESESVEAVPPATPVPSSGCKDELPAVSQGLVEPATPTTRGRGTSVDLLPGALVTSQLKIPFYADQAQHLLSQAKLQVLAYKASLFSAPLLTAVVGGPGGASSSPRDAVASALLGSAEEASSVVAQTAAKAGEPQAFIGTLLGSPIGLFGGVVEGLGRTMGGVMRSVVVEGVGGGGAAVEGQIVEREGALVEGLEGAAKPGLDVHSGLGLHHTLSSAVGPHHAGGAMELWGGAILSPDSAVGGLGGALGGLVHPVVSKAGMALGPALSHDWSPLVHIQL